MCMADMYRRAGRDFAVAHCNFHLRGSESDGDAVFVERWAQAHGVRFFRADFDTSAYASEHGISIEMAARELRYSWFARIAVENGFNAVAVAHNANDNAETLILNLLRGTGLRGITGISPDSPLPAGLCPENRLATLDPSHCRQWAPPSYVAEGGTDFQDTALPERGRNFPKVDGVRLVRPLLGMTRAEIEAYAAENGVEYREDRTNAENDARRNRIRNEVFPEFAEINPSFIRTLNSDMKHFSQAEAVADDYFREAKAEITSGDGSIDADRLLALRHWEYVLFRITEPCGFSAGTLDALTALLSERKEGRGTFAGKRFHSPTHVLETSSKGITLRRRDDDTPAGDGDVTVCGPGIYEVCGQTVNIELLPCKPGMALKQKAGTLICDAEALPFPFTLRGWRAGDWMRPFGMGGRTKKLSDLFTDAKYSLSDKEAAVIVESPVLEEGHVAAVAGLRMDEALRVAKGSVQIVRITIL